LDLGQLVGTAQLNLHLLFLGSWGVNRDNIVKQRRQSDDAELTTLTWRHQAQAIGQPHNPRDLHR